MRKISTNYFVHHNAIMDNLVTVLELKKKGELIDILTKFDVTLNIIHYIALVVAEYKYEVSEEGNHIFGQVTHFGLISTIPSYKLMLNCFSSAESCENWECWNIFYNLEDKLGLHGVDSDKNVLTD